MKILYSTIFLVLLLMACQPKPDTTMDDLFTKNSETVMKSLQSWQDEKPDYSVYADSAVALNTYFGAKEDTVMIMSDAAMNSDKEMLARYDFELLNSPPSFLPGVNPDTKEPDGSVRYYGAWKVTLPATDSTEAKSGILKIYESYDFNKDGKIIYQQGYGDFSGLMMYLNN
ncbi:hypothetical protein [Gaetbulibacter aestuarii]|uniref:SnoaL-like domain-containing protein n=1 Tax=Gaetbulibacter aestuarii TaxID=1502358 RepID=A0ABW7MYG9_9FLAO